MGDARKFFVQRFYSNMFSCLGHKNLMEQNLDFVSLIYQKSHNGLKEYLLNNIQHAKVFGFYIFGITIWFGKRQVNIGK